MVWWYHTIPYRTSHVHMYALPTRLFFILPFTHTKIFRATRATDRLAIVTVLYHARTTMTDFTPIKANVIFIGLGAMGLPMAKNVMARLADGFTLSVIDKNERALAAATQAGAVALGDTPKGVAASKDDVVITMLPNDAVLETVLNDPERGLLTSVTGGFPGIHISCSTIHPDTSRRLAQTHKYVGAPVFARADGVANRDASIVVGTNDASLIEQVRPILDAMAKGVFVFSETDAGAGNVVKLCGNFMIAAAIESCAEAAALADCQGLDRVQVMEMLTSTIFDCLIYRGYGMRTAHRQHIVGQPLVGPGFALNLGYKDVSLARSVAAAAQQPMPTASLLQDRFLASMAKGRSGMDWSAVALLTAEEAGRDVSEWLPDDKITEDGPATKKSRTE